MARRYSNITQGDELKRAKDALETYRKTRKTKRGQTEGTPTVANARPKRMVAIKPFDTDVNIKYRVSVTKDSFTKLEPAFPTRVLETDDDLATAVTSKGFRPAKINYFEPDAAVPVYVKSKQTGLWYIKYPGKSYSCPFGSVGENEEESKVASQVKTAVLALSQKDYRRAWYQSEWLRA